jgi:hypothetical protein
MAAKVNLMGKYLEDSPNLFLPAIDPDNFVVLTPDSYQTWAEMFAANADKLDYRLRPGDYRKWGVLELLDKAGNSEDRLKTIRYDNPDVDDTLHPVQRGHAARIDAFRFEGLFTKNWLIRGLTVIGPSANPVIARGASNITIDLCLIEYIRPYGIRIRSAQHSIIQRCVIRESINGIQRNHRSDTSGIQVGVIDMEVVGIKILDNEIYNVGDGIQLTDSTTAPNAAVEVLIEGNDIYLEPSRYIDDTNTTWDENAIDIKAGSDSPNSTVIRNNRMWGMRRNAAPTALGEILVMQRYCQNVLVEDNIMGDAPRGMKDDSWPNHADVARPRNIAFRDNQFYDIHDYAALDEGAITRPVTGGISFTGNHFSRSDYLVDNTPPGGYQGGMPTYTDNILVEVGAIQRDNVPPSLVINPADNNTVATAPHDYDTYERKRWTGPEFAIGALALPLP